MTKNVKLKRKFSQVCVWPGTVVGKENGEDFENLIREEFGVRAQYLEEFVTGPDYKNGKPVEGTGGRNDLFFAVHDNDLEKFAIPRLKAGIRWCDDVLNNEEYESLYPERFEAYRCWSSEEKPAIL